jgi:hypothetical protein
LGPLSIEQASPRHGRNFLGKFLLESYSQYSIQIALLIFLLMGCDFVIGVSTVFAVDELFPRLLSYKPSSLLRESLKMLGTPPFSRACYPINLVRSCGSRWKCWPTNIFIFVLTFYTAVDAVILGTFYIISTC